MMTFKTTVSFKEYVRLIYGLLYSKALMKLLVGIALLIVLWIVVYYAQLFRVPKPLIYQYITLVLIALVQPMLIYYTVWKNYHSSNHLRETLQIEVSEKELKISGSSFYMEVLWSKVFKIEEQVNWLLIYQNNLSAILIDKKELSPRALAQLKEIIRGIPKIPVALLD